MASPPTDGLNENLNEMTPQERYALITRNLQEVRGEKNLRAILSRKEDPVIYWGTAPTGKPHIGYFLQVSKIADFLNANCGVKILIAGLHASLDDQKTPWALHDFRSRYYQAVIEAMLKAIAVPLDKLEFHNGLDFQLTEEYTRKVYKLSSKVTAEEALLAGSDVVRRSDESPRLSTLLYSVLQALDEDHLKVDAQFGGADQTKIFEFAEEVLPRMNMEKRIHLISAMVPGLQGAKMSSSDDDSKIDLLDKEKTVEDKLDRAVCPPPSRDEQELGGARSSAHEESARGDCDVTGNWVLAFCKYVLFPLCPQGFYVQRLKQHGGDIFYSLFKDLCRDYNEGVLRPEDLKKATAKHLNDLLEPIRREFESTELKQLLSDAYPN